VQKQLAEEHTIPIDLTWRRVGLDLTNRLCQVDCKFELIGKQEGRSMSSTTPSGPPLVELFDQSALDTKKCSFYYTQNTMTATKCEAYEFVLLRECMSCNSMNDGSAVECVTVTCARKITMNCTNPKCMQPKELTASKCPYCDNKFAYGSPAVTAASVPSFADQMVDQTVEPVADLMENTTSKTSTPISGCEYFSTDPVERSSKNHLDPLADATVRVDPLMDLTENASKTRGPNVSLGATPTKLTKPPAAVRKSARLARKRK
jgi:hypothetical protein